MHLKMELPNAWSKIHDKFKGKIDILTIIVGVLNIPLLVMGRTTRQKHTYTQIDLIDIYKTFYVTRAE